MQLLFQEIATQSSNLKNNLRKIISNTETIYNFGLTQLLSKSCFDFTYLLHVHIVLLWFSDSSHNTIKGYLKVRTHYREQIGSVVLLLQNVIFLKIVGVFKLSQKLANVLKTKRYYSRTSILMLTYVYVSDYSCCSL